MSEWAVVQDRTTYGIAVVVGGLALMAQVLGGWIQGRRDYSRRHHTRSLYCRCGGGRKQWQRAAEGG